MARIPVEVAYALPDEQMVIPLEVEEGTTLIEAVKSSRIAEYFHQIDIDHDKMGIYGKLAGHDKVLREHDRVEIYRPITCDPKEVRRQRAKKNTRKRKAGG
ncbi:MAG TPA: RnfH family protein [Gammaproteobacteria bacterium]|nr:RnfH family protein [Gammaproteobacteria bacterium]